MPKVFISHSGKDKPFVRKLKEDLNFNDIETWLDEDELKVGDKLYDSLMLGLESSTHFLIVLSNNIKGSEWVEAEINEALSNFDKKILKKIIPVILRKTDVPTELKDLFRADFSSIIFTINGDKVQFTGDTYLKELEKIVKAVNQSSEFILSKNEKTTIVKETDTKTTNSIAQTKVVGLYEIAGFASNESRFSYVDNMKTRYKNTLLSKMATKSVVPVVLPSLLRPLFDKFILGQKIYFPVDNVKNLEAHFCGYSSNNTRIIVPGEIRRAFGISPKDIVRLEIDGTKKTITFID